MPPFSRFFSNQSTPRQCRRKGFLPALAALVGLQVNLGTVFGQAGLRLLSHAEGANAVLFRMVEIISVAFAFFKRGQELWPDIANPRATQRRGLVFGLFISMAPITPCVQLTEPIRADFF